MESQTNTDRVIDSHRQSHRFTQTESHTHKDRVTNSHRQSQRLTNSSPKIPSTHKSSKTTKTQFKYIQRILSENLNDKIQKTDYI
jgi:hypothetical protein